MIDNLSLALTHGLLLIAILRLLRRPDLDDEQAGKPARPARRRGPPGA